MSCSNLSVANNELVLDLKGWRYFKKWVETVRAARRQAPNLPLNLPTRLAALRKISRPVFFIGCPRSGTTYLGSIAASLPRVTYCFEPPICKYYSRLIFENRISARNARLVYSTAFKLLLLFAPGNGSRIVEKNPKHTWIVPQLLQMFPDAKFVMIARDGRDVALSLEQKPWHLRASADGKTREPGCYLYGPYAHFYVEPERREEFEATTDFHRCIWIWARYAQQMKHLLDTIPADTLRLIKYEELLINPIETVSDICKFIGEDDDDSIRCGIAAAKAGRLDSIGKWQLQFDDEKSAITKSEAERLLLEFGYEN